MTGGGGGRGITGAKAGGETLFGRSGSYGSARINLG